jgi:uncharacterized protein (TIGR00730 family)
MLKKVVLSLLSVACLQATQIGVFCATDDKIPASYKEAAFNLGEALTKAGFGLTTGGANSGLMNAVMDGFASQGTHDKLHGVMPALFKSYNVHHKKIPESNLSWTENIYHRLQTFHDHCDAMVVMPGGFGTLHELMDFLVPKQWGLTNKKIILFNFDNFWDHQLRQFDKMVETNALQQKHLDLLTVVTTVDECIQILCETKTSDLRDLDTRYWEKED